MNRLDRWSVTFVILLATLFALLVGGCGGNNSADTESQFTLTKTPIQAQIQLPTGTPISDLTTLTPWSSGGATNITSGGASQITIFNNGPQYADVRDNQGRIVLLAYLSSTQKTLNVESTAETLVFFAIGGAAQIGEGSESVLAGVKHFPVSTTSLMKSLANFNLRAMFPFQMEPSNQKSTISSPVFVPLPLPPAEAPSPNPQVHQVCF